MDLRAVKVRERPDWQKQISNLLPFDSSFAYLGGGWTSEGLYAARGILICLVVLGHESSDWSAFNALKRILYDFHVYGFFLISMMHPVGPPNWNRLLVLLRRNLLPMLYFSSAAFVLFQVVVTSGGVKELVDAFPNYLLALMTGNAHHFDRATGLELFWFLPALIGLVVLRMLAQKFATGIAMRLAVIIGLLMVGTAFAIYFADDAPSYLSIPSYILPFGVFSLLVVHILNLLSLQKPEFLIIAIATFFLMSFYWVPGHSYNLAHLRVPTLVDPLNITTHVVYVGLAFFIVLRLAIFYPVQYIFAALGRQSLGIYLTHMFFLIPISKLSLGVALVESMKLLLFFSIVIPLAYISARIVVWR